ncbi:MAG: PaeR7I family type II restriction endonuclease [Oscillospiraceae bacterium]|jgi:hypothetical protein|nr:PaeR7I family type II restriction endonuclease [Oscillospiraceae bacterium]
MNSISIPKDIEQRIRQAVQQFWSTRDAQITHQEANVFSEQGNRGAVTGGKQLDGFVELLRCILIENGVRDEHIFCNAKLELPGFYRPSKKWDLLVVDKKKLVLAIELKSQVGPSFGNNFNNRTEEAMGSSLDIWTAFREGLFRDSAPWLGYFMLLEDCAGSSTPVSIRSPHFSVMAEFENSSYTKRYEVFCNKLVLERQYHAACFLTTRRNEASTGGFAVPSEKLSMVSFLSSMLAAIFAHRAMNGGEM